MLPKPLKKNYTDTKALVKELPQLKTYTEMNMQFEGNKVVVRIRKKDLGKKPLLYLWDMDRSCYLSSLYPQSKKDSFKFDVAGAYYNLTYIEGTPQISKVS